MKIAFDARWIHSSNLDGLGGYALNLLIHLLKNDPQNRYLILFDREDRRRFIIRELTKAAVPKERFSELTTFSETSALKNTFWLPRILGHHQVDVAFAPNYIFPPFFKRYKTVVMVPDLIPFYYPRYLKRACYFMKFIHRFRAVVQMIFKRSDLIIALSKGIQKDIETHFKIDPAKIKLVYPGIEDIYFQPIPNDEIAMVKKIYSLPDNYILYFGRHEKEKNIDALINAYARLPEDWRSKIKLFIGGLHSNLTSQELDNLVSKLGIKDNVIFPGYIAKNHRPTIIKMAKAMVFPSSYEGFPLVVFEAMAAKVPVVASERFKSECGEAICAVESTNNRQIADELKKLLSDFTFYSKMQKTGQELAGQFRWDAAAKKVLKLLNSLGPQNL
ncbi:MAG: glycosyltransferase family 4 protein [Candidatus Margulisbacteria bacterium]|nr:glycosyltransferase family 4 protein [Candidatus Margulisiibacteriota bacterium]MBU1021633.1 glycosyltransferase family 4 protein [Candidatus Margulisiibacteriota bacterium]MBU1728783.1 glycosyltransferase family 4 protein [Candidatus Margulisiibacteriota bacterium]MBU1955749.1 glycosyltransferase family 4 protein [Candidatus Margulisiibacteriota bacterium]